MFVFCCCYDLENTVFRDDGHIMFYIDAKPNPVSSYRDICVNNVMLSFALLFNVSLISVSALTTDHSRPYMFR